MKLKISEYESILHSLEELKGDIDYIPELEVLNGSIEKNLDKYAVFILWMSENCKKPETEQEKEAYRKLIQLRNQAFEIEFEELGENQEEEVVSHESEQRIPESR